MPDVTAHRATASSPRNQRATGGQDQRSMLISHQRLRSNVMTLTENEIADLTRHNIDVWNRCAASYTSNFEVLTAGAIATLLDLANVGKGTSLLDIGTGPGTLIGPAIERGAEVSAIDVAPEMVDQAKSRHPSVDITTADAASLPHGEATFDAVTIGFCLHHVADARAVLSEANRVLRPGGRLSFAVWAPQEELEAFGLAFGAVVENVELGDVPDLQPPAIATTPADYEDLLVEMGFEHPSARKLELTWDLADGSSMFVGFDGFLDLSDQSPDLRDAVRRTIGDQITKNVGPDGLAHLPNPAVIAAASKPR
jgi:SAM-dependent methyltransferase